MAIDTTSQAAIEDGLRTLLLDAVAQDGATLRDVVGDRFFWDRAPDVAPPGLYVLAELRGLPPEPAYSDERVTAQLVLQVIARTAGDARLVKTAGDRIAQALRGLLSEETGATGGLVWVRSHYRAPVPRATSGPAAALVIEYHRTSLVLWPAYLFRAAD